MCVRFFMVHINTVRRMLISALESDVMPHTRLKTTKPPPKQAYRPGFVLLQTDKVAPGVSYTMIPSTFDPGQVGPYFFKVAASAAFQVTKI